MGMGCRFAGVSGPAALWDQAMSCRADFSDHPDLAAARSVDPSSARFDRLPTIRGGFLRELYAFDPESPILSDVAVEYGNADELFLAQLVTEALRDAGFTVRNSPAGRVSLAVGYAPPFLPAAVSWLMQTCVADQFLALLQRFFPNASDSERFAIRTHLHEALPAVSASVVRHALPHSLAAHTAGRFGFSGSAITVNAGCVSALAAIRAASDDLRARRSDLAVAAALQGPIPLAELFGIAALYPLTPHDAPQPFSRDAAGTLPGEGGGVLVLRRRSDAERNGERIYALVKSVALATGPRAPHVACNGAALFQHAIREAFREAEVPTDSCTYVESHGSGIAAEDASELEAMLAIIGDRKGFHPALALGVAKASIGHCLAAAGVAGACKAALALSRRIIPPAIVSEQLHPLLTHTEAPFYLPPEPRPWIHSRNLSPRRAGVTAWDGEGLAAHCLLEEYPEAP